MQEHRGIHSFLFGFVVMLLVVFVITASYIIIERGENRLVDDPQRAVTVTIGSDEQVNVAIDGVNMELDIGVISTYMDKLKPFFSTGVLLFIEGVDTLSSFGAKVIGILL